MRSSLHVSPPSTTLLKFLKLQSDGLCYFSANPGGIHFDQVDHRARSHSSRHGTQSVDSPTTCSSARSLRPMTLESAFPNLDFLWPRIANLITQASTEHKATSGVPRGYSLHISQRHISDNSRGWHTSRGVREWNGSSNNRTWYTTKKDKGWLRHIWGRKQNSSNPLKSDNISPRSFLEEGGEVPIVNIGPKMSPKSANETKLRCTEFDENGNVVVVNGEFKKSELIAKYGLLPRDLRKIDSSLLPHILVRPSAILINLLHIRCLIKANRVLVFDVYGSTDSYTQSVFMYDLEGKLQQKQASPSAGGLPYELRALEAVLISVTSALEVEFEGVREPVVRVLRELEEDIDRDKLRHLLIYSKKLGTFEQSAKLVRDAIDEVLEADDDLAAMYLTEKSHDLIRAEDDHTEVEMLLESYHKVCDEIVQASGNLVSNIRNTEEIVKAILDANRNSLMLLDLKFSIGTLGIGSGAFVAALYGMNLKNFLEETDLGFFGISAWSLIFAAIVCGYGLTKLRKVQRVSMWGEAGKRGGRGSWRNIDEEAAAGLLGTGRRERAERALKFKEERISAMRKNILMEEQRLPVPAGKAKRR